MIKESIIEGLKQALAANGVDHGDIDLEEPTHPDHGDFSTNIALKLSKKAAQSPFEFASKIVSSFPKNEMVGRIEAVKPGFINIALSDDFLIRHLDDSGDDIRLEEKDYAGKKVMVEYTDPNPFKEFHIGHLYSNTVGESLARIFQALGADVRRARNTIISGKKRAGIRSK